MDAQEQQEQELLMKVNKAVMDKDWDTADKALTEMEKSVSEGSASQVSDFRLKILLGRQDFAGAAKLAESLSSAQLTSSSAQNELAWTLSIAAGIDQPTLAVALKIATRADAAAGGKDAGVLDTLARVQFMNGKTNEAVATEQKALDVAPDEQKVFLKKFLTSYQEGKLPKADD